MKRTFLKVALLSSLMLSMPVAFTSCKDYDEDIKNLQDKDTDLQGQLDALKTAAANAQSAADAAMAAAKAAQTSADAAQSAADKAQKAAEAAAEAGKAAAAQAKVEAINEAIAQVNEILKGYATKEDLAAAVSRIAAIEDGLNKTNTAVDELKKAQAQMQIQLDALQKYSEFGTQIGLMQKDIDAVKADIVTINAALKNCVTAEQMNKAIDEVSKSLATKNANLITLLTKQLRSLVFVPSLYVDGIEATEYDYLQYNAMVAAANGGSGTTHAGAPFSILSEQGGNKVIWNAGNDTKYVNMPRTVEYELNPSTAEVKASDVTILSRYVETITRAVADPQIKFNEAGFVANRGGNLVVGYTALGQNLPTDKGHAWVMAAQVNNFNDDESAVGNITSDYAMVYGAPVTPLAIAYNQTPSNGEYKAEDCVLPTDELWKKAVVAGQNAPSVKVQWDGSVDLSTILEIHYMETTGTANAETHAVMTLQEAKDLYGLTMTYTPVQYTVGTNVTSDTKFTTLNGSVVKPCGVTADGQPTGVANKNSVGRNPLFMVQVMDGTNVVLTGYIKLDIVETKAPVVDVTTGEFNLGEVDFGCNSDEVNVTWAQINNILLGHVGENGISRDEFVADYELVKSGANAVQYNANKAAIASIGVITEVTNQTSATTNVLNWTLSMTEMQQIYEMPNHSYTVYVCYQKKVDSAKSPKYFLPLTVKVVKPQDIDNSANVASKSQNYWMRGQSVAITNVKVPENGGTPTYVADLDDEWYHANGSGVQVPGPVVNVAPAVTTRFGINSASFANENGADNGYKYYFTAKNNRTVNNVPFNGKNVTVKFSVDNATVQGILPGTSHAVSAANQGDHALLSNNGEFMNTTLYAAVGSAAKVAIATLNQATGEVTYLQNATAKGLLNAYASFDNTEANPLDRTPAELFVNVGICAYYGCNLVLPLTNGNWDAYFLRPVNVAAQSPEYFQDAANNGSTLDVFNMLTFSDWRNVKFTGANSWLYAYYQVMGVSIDTTKILSNGANGEFAINTTINSCFTYTPGSPAITAATCAANNSAAQNQTAIINTWKAAFGKLTYKNDGTNTNNFKVRIPVVITYFWGDMYVEVEADVKSTLLEQKNGRK